MDYRFTESERQHAQRLGGFQHRTRQLRRAILHILNGHNYHEQANYLVGKGLDELLRMAAVRLDGELLVSHGKPDKKEFLFASLDKMFSDIDPLAAQRAKKEMLSQGLFQGNVPYPYDGYNGSVSISADAREFVIKAFTVLTQGGSYTDVASALNRLGVRTASGKRWSKDTARSFCQNPIHAGYAVTYNDRLEGGTANKRGGMTLTRLSVGMPDPPITYDEWFDCNPIMQKREIAFVIPCNLPHKMARAGSI